MTEITENERFELKGKWVMPLESTTGKCFYVRDDKAIVCVAMDDDKISIEASVVPKPSVEAH